MYKNNIEFLKNLNKVKLINVITKTKNREKKILFIKFKSPRYVRLVQ